MPSLVQLYREFKGTEFVILAIDVNENKEKVKKYVQYNSIPFPVLLDKTGQTARDYGVRGTPAHFLIDKKGVMVASAMGARSWKDVNNRALIRYLINLGN